MDYNGYIKAHFDTFGYFGNKFITDNPSLLSRLSNLLVQAMESRLNNKLLPLPKIVVLVPDDDFIRLFDIDDSSDVSNVSKVFSRMLNYVMTELERNVAAFREYLPAKAIHCNYPHFLWIAAPLHDGFCNNSLHQKFNRSLEEVMQLHASSYCLHLEKVWDAKNMNFYLSVSQCFTAEGYSAYWEGVDRTVCYFDSILLKKQEGKKSQKMHGVDQKDHF